MRAEPAPQNNLGWLVSRANCHLTSDFRAIQVVDSRNAVRGMIGYCNWRPNSAQVHFALESPIAARCLIGPAFEFPFLQARVGVLHSQIPANNAKSVRIAKSFGFSESGRILDGWAPGIDLICFEMRKENCRWIAGQRKVA